MVPGPCPQPAGPLIGCSFISMVIIQLVTAPSPAQGAPGGSVKAAAWVLLLEKRSDGCFRTEPSAVLTMNQDDSQTNLTRSIELLRGRSQGDFR